MPGTPAATARRQSEWDTPLPLRCPRRNCCDSTTANLPAASPALSARDSAIQAGYAFAIKGRTHGQNCTDRGYPVLFSYPDRPITYSRPLMNAIVAESPAFVFALSVPTPYNESQLNQNPAYGDASWIADHFLLLLVVHSQSLDLPLLRKQIPPARRDCDSPSPGE